MDHEEAVAVVGKVSSTAARALVPSVLNVIADIIRDGLSAAGGTGTDRLRAAVQGEIEEAVLAGFLRWKQRLRSSSSTGAA